MEESQSSGGVKKYLKIAVFYNNVSRVTALGELLYGVEKKTQNFICVNLGFGIGADIIINGEPFFWLSRLFR